MSVKSVYNFVPAPTEDKVFKPDWAEQVSHDIPFSDGESGEIELTITAKTPIFIRNGHSKQDEALFDKKRKGESPNPTEEEKKAIERYLSFSNVVRNGKKEYFIPATSIKGMIRNVLEIISKSRLTQIQDHRHSVRQIMKTKDTIVDEGYDLKDDKKNIRAGWLIEKDGKHYIYDCGKPLKIRYLDLDKKLPNANFYEFFKKGGKAKLTSNFYSRTARYKYEKFKIDFNKSYRFEYHPLNENDKQKSWVSKFQPLKYVLFANSNSNSFYGHIICIGQSSEYADKNARKGEYVFKGRKENVLNNEQNRYFIPENIYEDFLFVNRNNKSDELEDWTYFKKYIKSGIPVFFRIKEKTKEVKDFGIPFMYKQPARYSVKELSPNEGYFEDNNNYDLAEVIFGTTRKGVELKGRVFFSHMECKSYIDEEKLHIQKVVLGSPRSSYYPFYLKQSGKNGKTDNYKTYNNKSSKLSGFKRYLIHKNINPNTVSEGASTEMITEFIPLPEGTVFKGKIRYHNLKKAEIGALISAITFHNQQENTYHNLGYSKPFGYGKIKLEINFENKIDYLKKFEYEIKKQLPGWRIDELLSLAKEVNSDENIRYMELSEFQTIKNEGKYLEPPKPYYSDYHLISRELLEQEENKKKEEERKKREEEEKRFKETIKKADEFYKSKKWEEALKFYEKSQEFDKTNTYIKQKIDSCKTYLNITDLSELNHMNNLSKGRTLIQKYYKAKGGFAKNDISIIHDFIVRVFQNLNEKDKRKWKNFSKDPWKFLKRTVGQTLAQQLYDELIKNKK